MNNRKLIIFLALLFLPHGVYARKVFNLNTSTYSELLSLKLVDKNKARKIIRYREVNNGFDEVQELELLFDSQYFDTMRRHYRIYNVPEDVWKSGITKNHMDLRAARLEVKTFALNGYAVYITFPDGGNMLVDTGFGTDSGRLVSQLKKEMITSKEGRVMSEFGWKPRIDWLVITNKRQERVGGLKSILENFKVREIVTAFGLEDVEENTAFNDIMMDPDLVGNCMQTNLIANEDIDLKQTISPVKLTAIGPEYAAEGEGASLCLKLAYSDISFLFLSTLSKKIQRKISEDHGDKIEATFLFASDQLSRAMTDRIRPKYTIKSRESSTVITDGYLVFKKEGLVRLPPAFELWNEERLDKGKARRYYKMAMYLFAEGRKKEASSRLLQARDLDSNYLVEKEMELFQESNQYLRSNDFEKTKETLKKVLFINPDNLKAKYMLQRAEEVSDLQ